MSKCEHHDDYVRLHDGLKDHVDRVERALTRSIDDVDKKTDAAFRKIDKLRDDVTEQSENQVETAAYVKQLYKRFDELTTQMQGIVTKLDAYITTMAAVNTKTEQNADFTKSGKKLVYDVIKWVVIGVLAFTLGQNSAG